MKLKLYLSIQNNNIDDNNLNQSINEYAQIILLNLTTYILPVVLDVMVIILFPSLKHFILSLFEYMISVLFELLRSFVISFFIVIIYSLYLLYSYDTFWSP